ESPEERAAAIWTSLARAMLGEPGAGGHSAAAPSGGEMAREFESLPQSGERDAAIVGQLQQAAAVCADRHAAHSAVLRGQVSRLLAQLRPATLQRLLTRSAGRLNTRLALGLTDVAPAPLALDLLLAASSVEDRTLSPALVRLLGKLSLHAETGPSVSRHLADEQPHAALRDLIGAWSEPVQADEEAAGDEPPLENPPAPLVADLDPTEAYRSDPLRILTMQLDMGE